MNLKRILRLAFWLVIMASLVIAVRGRGQTLPASRHQWVGVWQGELDGVPGVVLTLSDDIESPGGTIVFTVLGPDSTKEHPNIVGHQVRAIMHPKANGDTLLFRVKGLGNPKNIMEITFTLTGTSKGQLKCLKCGSATPVEMRLLQ
jgi:hypothetical protein